ncbi:MAG TPA: carboxylesterase/lipase family protein [Ktedonobacteraceae bacterium]|nr:carboxylesterase/lipase family protein [Ktedonobacteraceae bacterium]
MSETIVETTYGEVRGIDHGTVSVWKGIPFARPPVGERRFRPPQPPEAWEGVRDATQFGTVAPQAVLREGSPLGNRLTPGQESEDCLYLNVWSPAADGKKRPVMVWIHGGAFTMGSGSTPLYDGTSFAEQGDVVVVTLNYRLGVLGFLYLDELGGEQYRGSGNNGILDQVAALQWVHDNIEHFGGDPNQVTIFGESAGAMSVGTLLAMPAAKGLFRRAILQSGAATNVRNKEMATKVTKEFLDVLGLQENEAGKLVQLPLADVMAAQASVLGKQRAILAFGPVVDGTTLPQPPVAAIASGFARDVTVLVGTNRDEARLFSAVNPGEPDIRVLKHLFGDEADRVITTYSAERAGEPLTDVWSAIQTDQMFRIPAIRLAELQARQGAPVWMYRFDWASPAFGGRLGAAHAIELAFVWNNIAKAAMRPLLGDAPPQELAQRMHAAWIAFARTGNPKTPALPDWPAYNTEQRATMLFNTRCQLVDDPDAVERRLWEGIAQR